MNVKSNLVFVIRVQGMALVNCTGAELALEQIKGYKGLWCQKYILRLFFLNTVRIYFCHRNDDILVSVLNYLFSKKKSI